MNPQIAQLTDQLRTVYGGSPWYGQGVQEKLTKINLETVNVVKAGKVHTVGQLLQHMIAWRTFVIHKLQGFAEFKIQVDSEADWAPVDKVKPWTDLLVELQQSQDTLLDTIEQLDDESLSNIAPGTSFTLQQLIQGIIHHDIYHLGQIAIVDQLPPDNG